MTTTAEHILIYGNSHGTRASLAAIFEDWGYHVEQTGNEAEVPDRIARHAVRMLLIHLQGDVGIGRRLTGSALEASETVRVVVLMDDPDVDAAVGLMHAGAHDVMVGPPDNERLDALVSEIFHGDDPKDSSCRTSTLEIVSEDPGIHRLIRLAEQVADASASVLIQGESGTGKELFARYIHGKSNRRGKPFVAVNCAALPENLLESELFGYEKGAFTGAATQKPGKFELAHTGTLLLDEITEMPLHLQAKLLRVIQEKEVDRLGGVAPVHVDARIIATSNREIRQYVEDGGFREDLYYRINTIPLKVPSLKARPGDISLLARHFIDKYNALDGRSVKGMTDEAMACLMALPFPGNVRELENLIHRAVLLAAGDTIDTPDLMLDEIPPEAGIPPSSPAHSLPDLDLPLKDMERHLIFQALEKTGGNRTHAAKRLGISVRTLRNKLNEYKDLDEL